MIQRIVTGYLLHLYFHRKLSGLCIYITTDNNRIYISIREDCHRSNAMHIIPHQDSRPLTLTLHTTSPLPHTTLHHTPHYMTPHVPNYNTQYHTTLHYSKPHYNTPPHPNHKYYNTIPPL